MAKKVYVLTNGCYSDYRVVGVFSTDRAAQRMSQIFDDDPSVLGYELDQCVDDMEAGRSPWFVRMERESGDVMECYRKDSDYGAFDSVVGEDMHKNLYTTCWAEDRERAAKIAADRRRMFLAAAENA